MKVLGIAGKTYQKKLSGNIFINVNPEEHIQQQLFWYGYYEKPTGLILNKLLKPDSVFVDIGANTGYFSLLAACQATRGRVIAFEPVSFLYNALQANVALNKFDNIEMVKLALGEKEENRIIYLSGPDNEGMSSLSQPENYSGKSEMVKVSTLDKWTAYKEIKKIDVIKIDVEGSELSALKGMKETISRFHPYIIIELNPHTLNYFSLTPADVLSFVSEISYEPFILSEKQPLEKLENKNISDTADLLLVHSSKSRAMKTFSA